MANTPVSSDLQVVLDRLLNAAKKSSTFESGETEEPPAGRRRQRAQPEVARGARKDGSAKGRSPSFESGRYDVDLAEFPLFRFYKNRLSTHGREPLVYADTITAHDGEPVKREWKVYPGSFGFGGGSTQDVLYELLQIYGEQGFRGSQIVFGTLRSLFLRINRSRAEVRNPSESDYARLRRDLDVLRGYDFHCRNAFWDRDRKAYVDMHWRLFNEVFYFKPKPNSYQEELPFGFIEASSVLQQIARTRGFFCLGFDSRLFHGLKPLEQRLATYIAKKFMFQEKHQRFVDDLARALPIEAVRSDHVRRILKEAAQGLLEKGVPILDSFEIERSRASGEWLAIFHRKIKPAQDYPLPASAAEEIDTAVLVLVEDMIAVTGNADDRLWWSRCAERLGMDAVHFSIGQLKEQLQTGRVKNPGGLLTKILKDQAQRRGVLLSSAKGR